jgi:2-keto-3-deoxy-L-rhamnonate aldolase RhmA
MHEKALAVVKHLVEMKELFDVVCVKAEFEAQGMTPDELKLLDIIANRAGLKVALKVGGVEAVTDLNLALDIGVGGIIFPMAETPFALKKALDAANKYLSPSQRKALHLAVNVETETACLNLTQILEVGKANGLDAVTVGRVDLVGSLGLGRDAINSERIYKMALQVCMRTKMAGLEVTIGGGIEVESYDFINRLVMAQVLDRFETRMIVFKAELVRDKGNFERAIRMAHKFELLWSEFLADKYTSLAKSHLDRSAMLKKRIGEE